jgi:hypothetical protein
MTEGSNHMSQHERSDRASAVSPVLASVFGIRPTSFDELAQRHAAVFRGDAH